MNTEDFTKWWENNPSKTPSSPTNLMLDYNNTEGLFGMSNGMWNNLGQVAG